MVLLVPFGPLTVLIVWYTHAYLEGSLLGLWQLLARDGVVMTLGDICWPVILGSPQAWAMIGCFTATQLLLVKYLPGRTHPDTCTSGGDSPQFRDNGVTAFSVTVVLWFVTSDVLHLYSSTIIYDHFGELLGALNILAFCGGLFLFIKGRFFLSSGERRTEGSIALDFYRGTELYPQVAGIDVKLFTKCRFGVMAWSLILLSFAAKSHRWRVPCLGSETVTPVRGLSNRR